MPHVDDTPDTERRARRWAALSAERERLLTISRRRTLNHHDAEDCVQEALLRSVEFDDLDEARIGPFLTSVTMRLCADQHRARQRQDRLDRRVSNWWVEEPGPEEAVCDRSEAAWIAASLRGMPARQQQVIQARMEGLSDAEIADRLGVSYSSIASALARARSAVKATLAGCASLVALLRRTEVTVATAAAVAFVVTPAGPAAPSPAPPARAATPAPRVETAAGPAQPAPAPLPSSAAQQGRPAPAPAEPAPATARTASPDRGLIQQKETRRDFREEVENCLRNGYVVRLGGESSCGESSPSSVE